MPLPTRERRSVTGARSIHDQCRVWSRRCREGSWPAQALAASTAYTKRNVQEAVTSLTAAGVLTSFEVGNEQRFSIARDRWAQYLGLDELPGHKDWPQLFAALRMVLRWLADPAHEGLSDYMLSSEARTLAEAVRPDLHFAGIPIDVPPDDPSYLESFIRQLLDRALT